MDHELVDAAMAAEVLGVTRPTLYSYVSRGLLAAHRREGDRRSWFDPGEVERLRRRGRGGGGPDTAGPAGLGLVDIRSAITLIAGGRYWYRGRDPVTLAGSATFEQVAELLWTGALADQPPRWPPPALPGSLRSDLHSALGPRGTLPDLLRVAVPALAARDPLRTALQASSVVHVGRRLLPSLVALLDRAGTDGSAGGAERPRPNAGVAGQLWPVLSDSPAGPEEIEAVQAALVLLADHELAASTSAVRIAASFRADPYAAVSAGLAVLSGAYHGAASVMVERFLAEVESSGDAAGTIGDRLGRGETIPGLGQSLYPGGDPRAPVLLARARRQASAAPANDVADAVLAVAAERGLPPPNVDFGLAVLARALAWRPRSGEILFTVARIAGWLAHVIEEYDERSDLRLRAVYVGPRPT